MTRRAYLMGALAAPFATRGQTPVLQPALQDNDAGDWVCPMDPDVRQKGPGVCPRCGMKLVAKVPDRVSYRLEVKHEPAVPRPHEPAVLTFRAIDPRTNAVATKFEVVHERLMHLFIVSEDLEYFLHDHPVAQTDGSFQLTVRLERGGLHRMLADFYPAGSVPQLAPATLYAAGESAPAHLTASAREMKAENLTATLQVAPEPLLAGFEARLTFLLAPQEGIEPYLGAWGHMLAVSEDLIDMLHMHPFLSDGAGTMQFNVIFPRAGRYKIWTQFQRQGVVNTTVFVVEAGSL